MMSRAYDMGNVQWALVGSLRDSIYVLTLLTLGAGWGRGDTLASSLTLLLLLATVPFNR